MLTQHSVPRAGFTSALVVGLFSLLGPAPWTGRADAQTRVGSFVSGERPLYLEVDQVVDGQPFHIKFMNVPPGSTEQTIFFSDRVFAVDLGALNVPGFLGPDTLYGGFFQVNGNDYVGTLAKGFAGKTFYLQGYVKTPAGGRLTSMVATRPTATNYDGSGMNPVFPIPLTTQEILPTGRSGYSRIGQPVRVGIPIARGLVVETSGMPQLTLRGGPKEGQFSTLATWPDGSCKWVLCEYLKDLGAGQWDTSVSVDRGTGNFGGGNLASASGTVTTVATGSLAFTIDSAKDDLFQTFQLNGKEVFSLAKGNRPRYWDDKDQEWTWHKTAVRTRRNGPVRAEIEVDGCFTRSSSASDADRLYVRFYLEAFKGQSAVRATVSLRDTSLQFPEHALFRGFTFRAWLNEPAPIDVRLPTPAANGLSTSMASGTIGSSQDASWLQGFVKNKSYRLATDHNAGSYKGHVQRKGSDDFAIEGVCARIGSNYYSGSAASNWFSTEGDYCDPAFFEVTSAQTGRGVLFGLEHACRTWPVEYQAGGDGRVELGIFPRKAAADTHHYPLTWASSETRSFWLVAEGQRAADPFSIAASFDFPVAARSEPWAYNQAEVWPWMLTSCAEMTGYISHAGLRTPKVVSTEPVRSIYRYSGGTGGGNNNWEETRRFNQWLRAGHGGAYLNSWFEALYKADKMAWVVDDGALKDRKTIRNPNAPVTKKSEYYDGSKHIFFQAVHDWAFTRGETCLLDSAKNFADTVMDRGASPNVFPGGSFLPSTYGAVLNGSVAILEMQPNQAFADWLHLIFFQWANIVLHQQNDFNVNTSTCGWQATVGTPEGSATNPDAYFASYSTGKSSDRVKYGYLSQMWTDLRQTSAAYLHFAHYLREHAPTDPLIDDLRMRGADMYHYARRGLPDDHCKVTGEHYIIDILSGDANDPNCNPLLPPGKWIDTANPSGYALQAICNLLLEQRRSETAYSYGVELHRSMSDSTFDAMVNDPMLNDFAWRYSVHYGLIKP